MKKSLSHLPKHKQDELKLIRDTIVELYPGRNDVIRPNARDWTSIEQASGASEKNTPAWFVR